MIRWFSGLPISSRLLLLLWLFAVAMLAGNIYELAGHKERLRSEKQLKTRHLVETAHSLAAHYHDRQAAGEFSEAAAKSLAIGAIRALRYEETEYFWINDLARPVPRVIMHPTVPALDGTVPDGPAYQAATSKSVGLTGRFEPLARSNLFTAMVDVVDAGGHGFVTYDWPKPIAGGGVSERRYPKLSYVRKFEPWGWIIGSGIYIDDLDTAYWSEARASLAVDLVWIVALGLLAWLIGRGFIRPLAQLQQTVDVLRREPEAPVRLVVGHDNEMGRLARSFKDLMSDVQQSRRTLADSNNELQSVLDASPVVLLVLQEGRIVRANRTMERMFGLRAGEVVGQPLDLCFANVAAREHFAERLERDLTAARADGDAVVTFELRLKRSDGALFWANLFARWLDLGDPARGLLIVIEDIDERRVAEAQLRLWGKAISVMSEGVMVTDTENRIVSVNAAFSGITGYTLDDVGGKTPAVLKSGRHEPAFYREMWLALERAGNWRGEIWNRDKRGVVYPEWMSINTVRDAGGEIRNYVAVFSDISERKAAETRIRFLAEHDALTGLPNRVLLYDRLDQNVLKATRSGKMMAVLFIDLDRFKNINDSLGHDIGDQLLREVARRIEAGVRESDTVSRQGGDEFVVLLADVAHQEDAARIAEKLIGEIMRPCLVEKHVLSTTASIGIAMHPADGKDSRALIRAADTAMYQSKDAGRNTFRFFTADMNARVMERMSLEHELRGALAGGQLALHYQLQVDTRSRKLVGMEALLRWQHPEMGMISPARFIPVAEESGLILEIGNWVLAEACRQNRRWQEAGLSTIPVAVNVSAMQFRHPQFVDNVRQALDASGLPPEMLELELTESLMMTGAEQNIALLEDLRAMGLKLSIDDFGTGYSSLSYLKRFPIDKIKIDQAFVRDVAKDRDDEAIIEAIIALAHTLGLTVIAEGVETEEQLEFLKNHGCDEIQGYLFCRPQAAAAIELRLVEAAAAKQAGRLPA